MKTRRKAFLIPGIFLALGAAIARPAAAFTATTSYMDLTVTFQCTLSVSVDGVQDSSYTAAGAGANVFVAPPSSATVKNDSGCTEKWEVDASTLPAIGGSASAGWKLHNTTGTVNSHNASGCIAGCPGAEEYGVQVLFVSSNTAAGTYGSANACPAVNDSRWDSNVTTVPAHVGFATGDAVSGPNVYLNSQYADSTPIAGTTGNPDNAPNPGDMYSLNSVTTGAGQRGLCMRVTMPQTTAISAPQVIRLAITAIGG